MIGIVAQDVLLSRRDFRTATAAVEARAFELRRWRLPVEIALWTLAFFTLVLPLTALLLASLVPAAGVPLDVDERDARQLSLRALRARRGAPRLRQQLRPVGDGGDHRSR